MSPSLAPAETSRTPFVFPPALPPSRPGPPTCLPCHAQERFTPELAMAPPGVAHEPLLLRLKLSKSAGGIGEAICTKAADLGADLVLIDSHGAGVLADFGSVARWASVRLWALGGAARGVLACLCSSLHASLPRHVPGWSSPWGGLSVLLLCMHRCLCVVCRSLCSQEPARAGVRVCCLDAWLRPAAAYCCPHAAAECLAQLPRDLRPRAWCPAPHT